MCRADEMDIRPLPETGSERGDPHTVRRNPMQKTHRLKERICAFFAHTLSFFMQLRNA